MVADYDFFDIEEEDVPENKFLGNCGHCHEPIFSESSDSLESHEDSCFKNPKNQKPKELCPHCSKEFRSLTHHLKTCSKNPANKPKQQDPEILNELRSMSNIILSLQEEMKGNKDLVEIGKKHVLSEENLINHFKLIKSGSKAYLLYRYFDEARNGAIESLLKKLVKKKVLKRNKDGWYFLK